MCVCACRLSIYDDDDYNRIKPRERVGQWDGLAHTHRRYQLVLLCVFLFLDCVYSIIGCLGA